MLHFQVVNESLSWSYIFGTLEDNKETLKITDYSVSQTSLEQVSLYCQNYFMVSKKDTIRKLDPEMIFY